MKIILLILGLYLSLNAIMPSSAPAAPAEDTNLNVEIIDPVKFKTDMSKEITQITKSILDKKEKVDSLSNLYFEKVDYTSTSFTIDALVCPPLRFNGGGYNSDSKASLITRVSYMSPRDGIVECSVYNQNNSLLKPLYVEQFKNPFYAKQFAKIKANSNQSTPVLISNKALELNNEFAKNISSQTSSYLNDTSALKKLNYTDLLDAIAGLNTDIINVQESVNNQNLIFNDGYYYEVNNDSTSTAIIARNEAIAKLKEVTKEVMSKNGINSINPFKYDNDDSATQTLSYSTAEKITGSDTLFTIEWLLLLRPVINELFWFIFLAALAWNVALLGHKYFTEGNNNDSKGKHLISSALILASMLAFNNQTTSYKEINEFGAKLELASTRLQNVISILYMETNAMADSLVKSTISLYLKHHHQKHNIFTSDIIKTTNDELYRTEQQLKMANELEQACSEQFDLTNIKNEYSKNGTLDNKHINNLYPDSEAEAFDLLKTPYKDSLNPNLLNSDKTIKDKSKIYGFSLCHQNFNKINSYKKTIRIQRARIDNFNNTGSLEEKKAKIELINSTVWGLYNKYGYMTIVYLPMIDSIQRTMDIIDEKGKQYTELIFNPDIDTLAKYAAKNAVLLAFFDLSSIQQLIKSIAGMLPTSWIPLIGDGLRDGVAVAATLILVDVLTESVESLKISLFMLLSLFALMLAWLHKFSAFVISPFMLLFAVGFGSNNQLEKSGAFFANIIYVVIKPILIIIAIILAIISLSFISSIYSALTADATQILDSQLGIFSFLFSGITAALSQILFLIFQFALLYYIIIKLPQDWAEQFMNKVNDMGSSIGQSLESKIERKM